MKNLEELIQKIGDISESTERHRQDTGELELFKVFRRENLNALKQLAPQHYSDLAAAFNRTEDEKKRLLLCECLQHAGAQELQPLFRGLLNQDSSGLRCCAMVALGKLGDVSALANLYLSILQAGDRRTRFFLGCAFIHARDKRGIDLLVSVLREEQQFHTFKDGLLTTSLGGIIYSHIIDGILHGLLRGEPDSYSENPFEWIAWLDHHGDDVGSIDPTKVPAHLLEYTHDMIAEIDTQKNH